VALAIAPLTPIPDARAYGLAIVVLYGLSAFSLSAQAYSRWLTATPVSFPLAYCVVLAAVIGGSTTVVGTDGFGAAPPETWPVAFATGLAGGLLAKRLDGLILRRLHHRRTRKADRKHRSTAGWGLDQPGSVEIVSQGGAGLVRRRQSGAFRIQRNRRAVLDGWRWGACSATVVAVLEETLHRGILLDTARLLPGRLLFAAACAGLVLAFALSHIWFGLSQVAAKLPLGAVALTLAIVYGTILPAIVAHVVFNLQTVADWERREPGRLVAARLAVKSGRRQ
jgi:hypothetical protein